MAEKIRIVADFGNRYTGIRVTWANDRVKTVNWSSRLEFVGYELEQIVPQEETSYITLDGGPGSQEWGGQTIIVGRGEGRSLPVYKFNGGSGKIRASLFFVLAMLPQTDESSYEVSEIIVLHPDPSPAVLEGYRKVLAGHHYYTQNGVAMDIKIPEEAVILMPEGTAGYYAAVSEGIIDPSLMNTLFDIGGLTTVQEVINNNGPVRGTRKPLGRGGVQMLAAKVGEIAKAKGVISGAVDTQLILDGLHYGAQAVAAARKAEASNSAKNIVNIPPEGKRYPYGSPSSSNVVYLDAFVPLAKKAWITSLSGEFDEMVAPWLSQHTSCLLLGGGVHYIPHKAIEALNASGYSFVTFSKYQPETANLEGAYLLADPQFLKRVSLPTKKFGRRVIPAFAIV